MANEVVYTESFTKLFQGLDQGEKEWILKMVEQLKENDEVGKPLRFKWFREKKYKNKRLYYLVYKEQEKILLISFATKKDQDNIIEHILQNKTLYKKFVENT